MFTAGAGRHPTTFDGDGRTSDALAAQQRKSRRALAFVRVMKPYKRVGGMILGLAFAACGAPDDSITELSQAMKNCPEPGTCPGQDPDDDPPPPPPPPPVVSYPDLAMELLTPAACSGPGIGDTIRQEIGRNFPSGIVEFQCLASPAAAGRARVGVWLRALRADETQAARGRGLTATALLRAGETFAAGVPRPTINKLVAAQWAAQPKSLNHSGQPASGPTHLSGYDLTYDVPNSRTIFSVTGYDTDPVPDLHFTYKLTDTFSTSGGALQCTSSTDFSKDNSVVYWLAGGAFLAASLISPWVAPFTFILANGFFIQGTIISSVRAPGSTGGQSFCELASMFPAKFLLRAQPPFLPPRQKMVLDYTRASVDTGIAAGGSWSLAPRSPSVLAAGTRYLDLTIPQGYVGPITLTAVATAKTDDMIAPSFSWTAEADGTFSGGQSQATFQSRTVTWQVPVARAGDQFQRAVSVSTTDAEGLTASGSTFFVFRIHAEQEDIPPVCKKKPWLPNCQL
jgi:hypothetical protein